MKSLLITLTLMGSTPAFAGQSIVCRKGPPNAYGGTINLKLDFNQNGSLSQTKSIVKVSGFTKNSNNELCSSLAFVGVNQSKRSSEGAHTTFFFGDSEGMLDVQLQFKSRVLNQSFRSLHASFVIGSEDANPETGFAFGTDVVCNSYTN